MDSILIIKDLRKSFYIDNKEIQVLRGINITIYEGEMVAITGASGVGKSTLLNILGTLDRPTKGEVLFRGNNLFNKEEKDLAFFRNSRVGFIFQFHHLLPEFNVLENTMIPAMIYKKRRYESLDLAKELLTRVGLQDRLYHMPGELSGGEQQRVAIARALINRPEIVLADEPTGNLDTHTGGEVFNLMKDIQEEFNTTFIVVTHNESIARKTDRILHMVDGQIVDDIRPE